MTEPYKPNNIPYKLLEELDIMLGVLTDYSIIINSHLNDFIKYDLWEKTASERAKFTDSRSRQSCFLDSCCYSTFDKECCRFCLKESHKQAPERNVGCMNVNTFLSEKKEHEVKMLSRVLKSMSDERKCDRIVDFGSGKGYLCQYVTNEYNMHVLGIEMDKACSNSAQKRTEKMKRADARTQNSVAFKTTTYTVNSNTLGESTRFVRFVGEQFGCGVLEERYLLTGLHACGELTPFALHLFVKEECFQSICIVGCCYNMITDFPMSRTFRERKIELGKQEKYLACQCPTKWKETAQTLNQTLLYRAIFEKIMADKKVTSDDIKHVRFRRIGKHVTSFFEYIRNLRDQYSELNNILTKDEEEDYYRCYSDQWPLMKQYHWIRMEFGPLIEKLILYDRLFFLMESGFEDSSIVRVFDPVISPRSYALISTRKSKLHNKEDSK